MILGTTQPSYAQLCKTDIDRRYTQNMQQVNDRIRVAQDLLKQNLQDNRSPDDMIRLCQQTVSKLRQQRDALSIEWILMIRHHQEPETCR